MYILIFVRIGESDYTCIHKPHAIVRKRVNEKENRDGRYCCGDHFDRSYISNSRIRFLRSV